MIRLLSGLAAASMVVTPIARVQTETTSVVWIYDCSQSHHRSLAPAPMDKFGVRSQPLEPLVQAVAGNMGPGTEVRVLSFGTGLRLAPRWVRTQREIASALDCGETLGGPSPIWDAVYRSAE